MQKAESKRITTGTAEWCDMELNIFKGCPCNCLYCYAKRNANHWGWKKEKDWENMEFNERAFNRSIPKIKKGKVIKWFMFPTSHNIVPENVDICLQYIKRILNETVANILIVLKPSLPVITTLVENLYSYKERVLFRFTITSMDQELLKKYESNAPEFQERFDSLRYAKYYGYNTSVSIEPFLDIDPIPLIKKLEPYCTETIWIGKLNYMKTKFNSWSNIQKVIQNIQKLPENIKKKIRLKDSIPKLYKKRGLELKI